MDKIVKAMRLKTGFEPLILDETTIAHFTVACLVAKPLNRSEANVDLNTLQNVAAFQK